MLTPDQQRLVEEAIKLVPVCVSVFKRSMPCLREVASRCDLESAGYLACCRAAKTFDPHRGVGISAYFSVAIKHGMLREVQNEIKSRSNSIYRIPFLEQDVRLQVAAKEPSAMSRAIMTLTDEERSLIEKRMSGGAVADMRQRREPSSKKKWRAQQARQRLKASLDKLRKAYEDTPGN